MKAFGVCFSHFINNSINDFFLRDKERDKYASQAIRSARDVENNLRQQLQQETGKKFILRNKQ